jgi:hypothetical protein
VLHNEDVTRDDILAEIRRSARRLADGSELRRADSRCLQPSGHVPLSLHTRLSRALEYILPDATLRMSPFAEMRDPRESRLLEIEGIAAECVPEDWDWREEIAPRFVGTATRSHSLLRHRSMRGRSSGTIAIAAIHLTSFTKRNQ